jgi:hypothetical protein
MKRVATSFAASDGNAYSSEIVTTVPLLVSRRRYPCGFAIAR